MSFLSKLFGKQNHPESRMQTALSATRADIVAAAEQKLGRSLSKEEKMRFESIGSLQILEAWYRTFTTDKVTKEQAEEEIRNLVSSTASK